MRRIFQNVFAVFAVLGGGASLASGSGRMPGGPMPGGEGPGLIDNIGHLDKPDVAAKKAYNAGVKSIDKAKEFEAIALKATNADKRAKALDKVGEAYNRALDQFTEALSNRADLYQAWNYAGYVHRHLGAYAESLDDYNHALQLKPDYVEAIEYRGEAYLGLNRLDEAKSAYMDLFKTARTMADQLMLAMQKWVGDHRVDANGVSATDLDAFDKWVHERDGIAKQTASLGHAVPTPDWK
jgi:tetratricopeptide (TPR) repeat protein